MPLLPAQERLLAAVRAGIPEFDGAESPQTIRLSAQFRTTGVAMSTLWTMTPMAWICPGCGRNKAQLVRPNRHNELMCNLVPHHDHMVDALEAAFKHYATTLDNVVATALGEAFAKRAAPVVSAFDRTVVCNDCNNADTDAKARVGAHRFLSFSSDEIRRFAVVTANAPHGIDEEALRTVYAEVLPRFQRRMKFIMSITEVAAKDDHWLQRAPEGANEADVVRFAESFAKWKDFSTSFHLLRGEQRKPNTNLSHWRTGPRPPVRKAPTPQQIEYVARFQSAKVWASIPDDWVCGGCGRTKVQCVRDNKAGKLALTVTDNAFRPEAATPGVRSVKACCDCRDVAIAMGKEANDIADAGESTYLRHVHLSEVRRVIVPQPNARHKIRQDVATAVLAGIAKRMASATQ